jgi:hypothetical protein
MKRDGHENIKFFYGTEIEHTPAHNMKTLFVVGVQPVDEIGINLKGAEHIYFGANMSFPKLLVDSNEWKQWEDMIKYFLRLGYWCTLDVDVVCAEGLCESGLTEYNNFIPMLSVKLPYIQQLGYNATIKLDDKDFAKTNPGVWCHSVHELMDRKKFTNWSQYTKDQPL